MKLAILGTRGIPANYGGFETFAEELSVRLAARGHDVTVYGRSNNVVYNGTDYKGVKLVILPTIGTKHLDTVAHTFLSVLHAIPRRFDAALICKDRKSTRLNSSHSQISYAVFCLKKKKKKHQPYIQY